MADLSGKVAIVTGASGGIGRATSHRLADAGAAIVAHYRHGAEAAEALVQEIVAKGGRAVAVGGDVASPSDAAAIVAKAVEAFGRIDILFNNAGSLQNAAFGEITPELFHEQFGANVLGVINMMQAAMPELEKQKGRVINMSTNLAFGPKPTMGPYSAAKAAVAVLTQGFARELGAKGVAVNAVAPGTIRTRMTDRQTEAQKASTASRTPLGRIGEPDDVADVVLFLASGQSRWVTGRTIIIDGGLI
jgi:3-oxoacyl-[acyl-carrier protein] reductase